MEMATIITGYAGLFSELGLGAAIIQRSSINKDDLSTVFWFGFCNSIFFTLLCVLLAYPTAKIFNDPKLISVTQAVSVLFIINGFGIVPANLLRKELNYKAIGIAELISIVISSSCMVLIAWLGGGIWTLVFGHIIRDATRVSIYYWEVWWVPHFHFVFNDAKKFLRFGIAIATGNSFRYITDKSDRFFAGQIWSAQMVGFYGFALQLANIPMEKIISLINQISFSALSQLQSKKEEFNSFFLNISKVILILVIPLYVGGYLLGEDIISLLLGEKWSSSVIFFKYLCLAQILKSLTPIINQVHASQGRARWFLYFHIISGILLSISFFYAVPWGEYGILIPWFTIYIAIFLGWLFITLKKLGIKVSDYILFIKHPIIAGVFMALGVHLYELFIINDFHGDFVTTSILLQKYGIFEGMMSIFIKVIIGAIIYLGFLWIADKSFIFRIRGLLK